MANYTSKNYAHNQYLLRKQVIEKYKSIAVDWYNNSVDREYILETYSISDLPNTPGIYFLHDQETDDLIYIGQSRHLKTRFANHHVYKPGNLIRYWELEIDLLRLMEWTYIALMKPPKNHAKYSIDTTFLNIFNVEDITGIKYKTASLRYLSNDQ